MHSICSRILIFPERESGGTSMTRFIVSAFVLFIHTFERPSLITSHWFSQDKYLIMKESSIISGLMFSFILHFVAKQFPSS